MSCHSPTTYEVVASVSGYSAPTGPLTQRRHDAPTHSFFHEHTYVVYRLTSTHALQTRLGNRCTLDVCQECILRFLWRVGSRIYKRFWVYFISSWFSSRLSLSSPWWLECLLQVIIPSLSSLILRLDFVAVVCDESTSVLCCVRMEKLQAWSVCHKMIMYHLTKSIFLFYPMVSYSCISMLIRLRRRRLAKSRGTCCNWLTGEDQVGHSGFANWDSLQVRVQFLVPLEGNVQCTWAHVGDDKITTWRCCVNHGSCVSFCRVVLRIHSDVLCWCLNTLDNGHWANITSGYGNKVSWDGEPS